LELARGLNLGEVGGHALAQRVVAFRDGPGDVVVGTDVKGDSQIGIEVPKQLEQVGVGDGVVDAALGYAADQLFARALRLFDPGEQWHLGA